MNLRMLTRNASLAETLKPKNEPSFVQKYHGKKIYVCHSPQHGNATGSFHGRVPRSLEIGGVSFPHSSKARPTNQDLGPQNFPYENQDSPYSGLKSNYNAQQYDEQAQPDNHRRGKLMLR